MHIYPSSHPQTAYHCLPPPPFFIFIFFAFLGILGTLGTLAQPQRSTWLETTSRSPLVHRALLSSLKEPQSRLQLCVSSGCISLRFLKGISYHVISVSNILNLQRFVRHYFFGILDAGL